MSTTQPEYINRQKLCTELRSGEHKQKRGDIGDWQDPDAPVCLIGVGLRLFPDCAKPHTEGQGVRLAHKIGLDFNTFTLLIRKNDVGITFYKLANTLESLPIYSQKELEDVDRPF